MSEKEWKEEDIVSSIVEFLHSIFPSGAALVSVCCWGVLDGIKEEF